MDLSFLENFDHVGAIVKDMDKTISQLSLVGVHPTGMPNGQQTVEVRFKGEYKNSPAEWSVKICMLKMGELNIELLQPTGGDSVFQEFIDSGLEGVHHVAYIVEDLEKDAASLIEQGATVVTKGAGARGGFYYLRSGGGIVIELRG
jgi:catechol 2,3-dioxygenase-like lactoylglutathione lyase family enzyme